LDNQQAGILMGFSPNDYPEREYTSSEVEVSHIRKDEDIVSSLMKISGE